MCTPAWGARDLPDFSVECVLEVDGHFDDDVKQMLDTGGMHWAKRSLHELLCEPEPEPKTGCKRCVAVEVARAVMRSQS